MLRLSGPDGLIERIAEHQPDLVITDHHMPRNDVVAPVAALCRRSRRGPTTFYPSRAARGCPSSLRASSLRPTRNTPRRACACRFDSQRSVNQAIVDQVPVGPWLMSPDGEVVHANRRGTKMLGAPGLQAGGFNGLRGWWSDSVQAILSLLKPHCCRCTSTPNTCTAPSRPAPAAVSSSTPARPS